MICGCVFTRLSGCISMLRYWSSLRYSSLRTLFLLADELRRQPTLGNTPPSLYCLILVFRRYCLAV